MYICAEMDVITLSIACAASQEECGNSMQFLCTGIVAICSPFAALGGHFTISTGKRLRMKMTEYLKAIKHAATENLRLVWSEREEYQALERRLSALGAEIKNTHERIGLAAGESGF